MLIMKTVFISFLIIQTLMVCSNGQMRPPNWDQGRFGPGTRFFGQDSDNNNGNGRRGFFGNDFGPNQVFPRGRPPLGGNDDRGQVPPQIPPPTNPEPMGPAGGMGPGSVQNEAPPLQPQPGQDLGQMGPGMEESPVGAGQEEIPEQPQIVPPPPPGQMGGAGSQGPIPRSGRQPPMSRGPVGGPQPPMREGPGQIGQGGGMAEEPEPEPPMEQGPMGQAPVPGQTEFINPQQPPVPQVPGQGGVDPRGQQPRGLPPAAPAQPPLNQPPMQPPIPQRPREIGPEELPGGQDVMRGPQFPPGEDTELGRQRRPVGQTRGVGQGSSSFRGQASRPGMGAINRPTKFQMS